MNELSVVAGPFCTAGAAGDHALARMLRWRVTRALGSALERNPPLEALASGWTFIEANWNCLDGRALTALPAVGQISATEDAADIVLRAALLFVALGAEGEFVIRDVRPQTVYLDIVPLTVEGVVTVRSGHRCCVVSVRKRGLPEIVTCYERVRTHWSVVDMATTIVLKETVSVQLVHAGSSSAARDFLGELGLATGVESAIRDTVESALEMINANYPDGLAWIAPVLRGLVLIHNPAGSSSGSSSSHPGLVFVSYPISVDHLAAQIVHECAHQYLAVHHAWSPFTDGNPQELYYSPFKQTTRPLYNLLLALHAAVNIREFTGHLMGSGVETPYVVAEHEQLRLQIIQMLDDVREAPGLTAAGRALVSRLDEAACAHG